MPKFKVIVEHVITHEVVVDAADDDEAENEAIELVSNADPELPHTDESFDIESVENLTAKAEEAKHEQKIADEGR